MASDDSTANDAFEPRGEAQRNGWTLVIVSPFEQTRSVSLDIPVTIGRGASCEICVPTSATSREHARVGRDGPICIVRDLGSKNGVFVDGRRIEVAPLQHGSVLRAGGCVGVVVEAAPHDTEGFRELAQGLFGGGSLSTAAHQGELAARSGLNIVLEAESGSGKERFARAVHEWSGCSGPFVAINCSALPANLAEAELFGYQRGAFTGAERSQSGYFRAATGGTLFLDELLELPLAIQAKLLRAVERREVIPLGATTPIPFDTQIVAATQVALTEAVEQGRVRLDLFARLNGVTIRIPPLRDRREDVMPLFYRFLANTARPSTPTLSPGAVESLCVHDWPLNVRELEAVAHRLAVLHATANTIGASEVAALIGAAARRSSLPRETQPPAVTLDPEWSGFVEALASMKGNIVRAAERVGISRQRAYRLISSHPEFDVASFRRAH
jgi:transcriptional regulator with AAA-type ATPase domain